MACACGVVEVVVLLLTILALQRGQGDLTAWSIPVVLLLGLLDLTAWPVNLICCWWRVLLLVDLTAWSC